jgi:hypothetical protein
MDLWTFHPDIGGTIISANLPEKRTNILLSGQSDLLINGSATPHTL